MSGVTPAFPGIGFNRPAGLCECKICVALDVLHPFEGRQMRLVAIEDGAPVVAPAGAPASSSTGEHP